MRHRGDEPHYDKKYGECAADAVNAGTSEGFAYLNGSKRQTGVRKDELV